jgi:hypothetical protein
LRGARCGDFTPRGAQLQSVVPGADRCGYRAFC